MSQNPVPARGIAPGRVLSRELEARGWTQRDLAVIMGRPAQAINEIIRGAKQITPETALELGRAFGTSPEFWMNLETNYRLYLARQEKDEKDIARRGRLYSLVPVSELIKRSWITNGHSIDRLEQEVCRFLGISSLDETLKFAVNLRVAQKQGPEVNAQIAWIKRVEHLAEAQTVSEFSRAKLNKAMPQLLACTARVEAIANVPPLLLSLGVHFAVVPHLPKTFLDGAVLYFDKQPVVALTLRHDRIDAFWFALLHELAHIVAGHKGARLDDLDSNTEVDGEAEANQLARDWLIDPKALDVFLRETKPYFSRSKIEQFALSQGRHPGIILGRLQHEQVVEYKHLRMLLAQVRPFLKDWIDVPTPQTG